MALFKPYKVLSTQLSSLPVLDGQVIFVTDTQEIYLDSGDGRTLISSKTPNVVMSAEEPEGLSAGDFWLVLSEE